MTIWQRELPLRIPTLTVLVLLCLPMSLHAAATLTIDVDGSRLAVGNLSAGDSVVAVSYVIVPNVHGQLNSDRMVWQSKMRFCRRTDVDHDGTVYIFDPVSLVEPQPTENPSQMVQHTPPNQSLTIAVDLNLGDWGVRQPSQPVALVGYERFFPALSTTLSAPAEAVQVDADGDELDLIVVRPGVGTWRRLRREEAEGAVSLTEMAAVTGATPALTALQIGDVVIAVNTDTLDYAVVRVGGNQ
jgi:hypothetical protein